MNRLLLVAVLLAAQAGTPDKPSPIPDFQQPVLFNTPEADRILAALRVFPKNSPWNEDISERPVHPDSDRIIAAVGAARRIGYNLDMGFILVPPDQKPVEVAIKGYGDESDPGPFPLPDGAPVEGWPLDKTDLETTQREGKGDRHVIVVDPRRGKLHEFYHAYRRAEGWQAACVATFDLASNALRPRGWTSSDAAGLPIFPSLPRYDECERGEVTHALRFTVRRSRKEFLYPATHQAGHTRAAEAPAMGQRFRLKAAVNVDDYPKHARAIALALKKYGMLVADNGQDWLISIPPDPRLQGLDALRKLHGSDFEVIETTGEKDLGR